MVVINKKRIQIITGCILISLFTFLFQIGRKEKAVEIKETVATPISNKTIVLDAGHGIPDEGAQSSKGTTEAETNLKITLKLQNLLEQSGCQVILTRSDENAIYSLDAKTLREKKISDIRNRVKIGNESSADIFVSIHLNKIPQPQYSGWQCFYNSSNEKSMKLSKIIQSCLNESIQKENNRVAMKLDTVYIMKHVEIPISIVECGFLSNPEEEQQLLDDSYQDRLAWGIYNGIMRYFSEMDS
ncbi:MAG: N-acetylmuramoyl-L-alanine amidase [Clostridia bacterium]|nr:N-acetylmuramoyl-L-alanine amidase [Clostridia bacterium]